MMKTKPRTGYETLIVQTILTEFSENEIAVYYKVQIVYLKYI